MIEVEERDEIAVVQMAHPPVNALDAELLEAIADELGRLTEARAVVLTGTGPAFSAGVNLFRILDEGEAYTRRAGEALTSALKTLFLFPRPVVAAVNGHAIAGGCVLVCGCDYRITSEGTHQIGLAELRVGVPFPAWALELARFAIPPQHLQSLVYTGRGVDPAEALRLGLVDEVVPPAELIDRALEIARRFASIPPETFAHTKRTIRGPTLERLERSADELDVEAARLWASEPVRASIRRFLDTMFGKRKRRSARK